ncbi:CRISPR-associated endonuclease Cas2 [Gammaproteobacteria bacterium]|nr:CRISPR-associated endonuclease Cas2 [Gammaproteobacteria bacterium]
MQAYLCCFDISDDRRRRRVAKALSYLGQRVQKSVYEIALNRPSDLVRLSRQLSALIEDSDDVRFYRLCKPCRAASQSASGEPVARFPNEIQV